MVRILALLALLAATPLAAGAEQAAVAGAIAALAPASIGATQRDAPAPDPVRAHFEAAMEEITADLPGLVVTSRLRTEADQERLRRAGYKPHRRSQHKRGLAWDCVAPEDSRRTLVERARARGFVALEMLSPVTGNPYVHVQRYPRSPGKGVPADPGPPPALLASLEPAMPAAAEAAAVAASFVEAALHGPPAPPEDPLAEIELPRPIGGSSLELPRRLLRKKASGRIVLLLELNEAGEVLDLEVESSDLPEFEDFVADSVRAWKFTPPTLRGRPIGAQARLPIPIHID